MIRALIEQTFDSTKKYLVLFGLSTDNKPVSGLITGSEFHEVDTGVKYEFDEVNSQWHEVGITEQEIKDEIDAWLDAHPDATTTVEDGAITNAKLASSFVTPGTAAAYSSSATYAVGDYCFHNGSLYRCTTAITTAETWTAAHWTVAVLGDDVNAITSIESISEQVTEYYTTPWTTGGGINADGELVSVGSWAYTDKIAVQAGDVITCDAIGGSGNRVTRPIRILCAYNNDSPVSASGSSSEISSYTVPAGISHIVVTQASFTSYTGQRVVINRSVTTSDTWLNQGKIGGFSQYGTLNDGDEFAFPITNVKQHKVFSFDGNITSFSTIKIGRNVDGVDKESVVVDDTNLTITNTYGAETVVAHGLTIVDNLQILLTTGNNNRLTSIRIISKGDVFEYTTLNNITWNADKGYPFVRSVGSVFTDCTASWTSRKINAPIWIFGDSYLSYDTARWAYYLVQDGYDVNCLLNAYAGENSQNAFTAFNSLMQSGIRPQIVVWALGMNDGDSVSDDAPNGNWVNVLNKVIAICEGRDVELILCTIPTTPIVNNNYKNAWVKNSGFRYVDFAAGVGADTDGVWFSGLLSPDNVHPTAEGAKTLYYKFLSEVPEIVTNN